MALIALAVLACLALSAAAALVGDAAGSTALAAPSHLAMGNPGACPRGAHSPALRTYMLTVGGPFSLAPLGGGLHELRFALSSAPRFSPFVINRHGAGLEQGLFDTRQLLADWAALAARAGSEGRYAMAAQALDMQCSGGGATAAPPHVLLRDSPSNAMLLLHGPTKASAVVDLQGVRLEGSEAVLTVRWVHQPHTVPEGPVYHAKQAAEPEARHYHHQGTCGTLSAPPDAFAQTGDQGVTIFMKNDWNNPVCSLVVGSEGFTPQCNGLYSLQVNATCIWPDFDSCPTPDGLWNIQLCFSINDTAVPSAYNQTLLPCTDVVNITAAGAAIVTATFRNVPPATTVEAMVSGTASVSGDPSTYGPSIGTVTTTSPATNGTCAGWASSGAQAAYEAATAAAAGVPAPAVSSNCTKAGPTITVSLFVTSDSLLEAAAAQRKVVASLTSTAFASTVAAAGVKGFVPSAATTACIVGKTSCAPSLRGDVWADPHVKTFTGQVFEYKGKPGATMAVLTAGTGPNAIRRDVSGLLAAWPPRKGSTIITKATIRAFGATLVVTQIKRAGSKVHTLSAAVTAANGTQYKGLPVGACLVLPGPLVVRVGSAQRVVAVLPTMAVAVTGKLPPPVKGVLAAGLKAASAAPGRAEALSSNAASLYATVSSAHQSSVSLSP
eukprot:scaffold4.g4858.t1